MWTEKIKSVRRVPTLYMLMKVVDACDTNCTRLGNPPVYIGGAPPSRGPVSGALLTAKCPGSRRRPRLKRSRRVCPTCNRLSIKP